LFKTDHPNLSLCLAAMKSQVHFLGRERHLKEVGQKNVEVKTQ
jgi:hypothetical protein